MLSLMSTQRRRKKAVFSPPPLSLAYKNVAQLIIGAAPPHLPTYIPHKCPILINLGLPIKKIKFRNAQSLYKVHRLLLHSEKTQIFKIWNIPKGCI